MTAPSPLHSWIVGFVRLLLEVEAGARPARHLRPMIGAGLQHRMRLTPPTRRLMEDWRHPGATIGRVLLQTSGPRCEAVVLLRRPERTTALTLTLARDDLGWLVVDLGRPGESVEHPELPPSPPALTQVAWHLDPPEAPRQDWRVPAGWLRPAAA